MVDVSVIIETVKQVVQGIDPERIASELAGSIAPLLQAHNSSEVDVKHQVGTILINRLEPEGRKRLPYGAKVMDSLSGMLDVSRSVLDRARQFARLHPDLNVFKTNHPDARTWEAVKKLLVTTGKAKANSSSQSTLDPASAYWKRYARSLDHLFMKCEQAPSVSNSQLVEECQIRAQALMEKLQARLSTYSTVIQSSPVSDPSPVEGDTQLESLEFSSTQ